MKKFDGILICTDLDGTLFTTDKKISTENHNAIEYFKANGGMFTFITGRMYFYANEAYKMVRPNVPVGCANGGAIYDYQAKKYIWLTTISKSAINVLEYIDENYPDIAFLINTPERIVFCKDNSAMAKFRKNSGVPYNVCDFRNFDEDISKIIFADEDESKIDLIADILNNHPLASEFDFVRSEHDLYEILPKGFNKGTILERLAEHLNVPMKKTIAIGDYDNDISMIEKAGIGIAVSNACDAAKKVADVITVSNNEHAIAKIISDIESGKLVV